MNKHKKYALPYIIWMGILIVIPIIIMILISFVQNDNFSFNFQNATFGFLAFQKLLSRVYISAFLNSFRLAFIATLLCVIFGYPLAYIISKAKNKYRIAILLLLVFPMFTNMLLQISVLNNIMKPISILNIFGISLNISGSEFAIVIVMIMMYLPFMVFPIYTVLEKIDPLLLEASTDLYANNVKTFLKVTLPLSMKGVSSGIIMVFLPCATGFAIPQIVSNGTIVLIGELIEDGLGFGKSGVSDYSFGALISVIILILVFGALLLISKIDAEGETLL